jgi:hypothetical protein
MKILVKQVYSNAVFCNPARIRYLTAYGLIHKFCVATSRPEAAAASNSLAEVLSLSIF